MERRTFIKNTAAAAGMLFTANALSCLGENTSEEFPLLDLHVHTTNDFTIEKILEIGEKRKVKFGIVDHPAPWALKDDNDLKQYIDKLGKYPVYIGLQPTYPGWYKNYSKELVSQLDYVLMDAQMVPQGNGETWQIWEFDTYIDDTEDFMKRYMDYTLEILNNEPINIFGWPLFLPVCIARDYYTLWTEDRMQQIIKAAKARNIAIEINDMSHTPHEEFILKAKEQGLKFTFGSDSRNQNVGRLAYCKRIAEKCKLTKDDFFVPVKAK
ncbi:MAG: twin-arginine translocation signal domain-containing protein [Bacteroidales bacterium]